MKKRKSKTKRNAMKKEIKETIYTLWLIICLFKKEMKG